jgi:uncharacterized membrane protein
MAKARLAAMAAISLIVAASGALFAWNSFAKGEIAGAILGGIIALIILGFALFTFIRGSKDLKEGYPVKDERSARVMEKATSKAFFVSLYLLLAIGYLSDDLIKFRDVSQATGAAVGGMALLFAMFWIYYSRKAM